MFTSSNSQLFCFSLLVYQSLLLGILSYFGISFLYSRQILAFLKIFIPFLAIGLAILSHLFNGKDSVSKSYIAKFLVMLQSLLALLVGASVYHVISVLLGASFLDNTSETFLLSCLLSTYTVFPLYLFYEGAWEEFLIDLNSIIDVENSTVDAMKVISCFSLTGCWFGAFPIPLDWDRDWQKWPITCCIGSVVGNLLGCIIVVLLCSPLIKNVLQMKKKNI